MKGKHLYLKFDTLKLDVSFEFELSFTRWLKAAILGG